MPRARGLLHADRLARQGTGDEDGLARLRMAFGPTRDATPVMDEVDDGNGLGGLVEAGHGVLQDEGPDIVSEPPTQTARRSGPLQAMQAYFCFQPPPLWYHQPLRALSTHCLANTLRIWLSHSGWPLATATSR